MTLKCVREADGSPAVSVERSAELLRAHWQRTFEAQPVDQAAIAELLAFVPVLHGLEHKMMEFDDFEKMVARTGNTAPGPDGIPYAFWRVAFHIVGYELFCHLDAIWSSGQPPITFNYSFLIFLPKLDCDESGIPVDSTRPLNLPNTDNKLFAKIADAHLSAIATTHVHFIRGRHGGDNIMLMESKSIEAARSGEPHPAAIFLDFKAAFPSISRTFMFAVMEAMLGSRSALLRALHSLYDTTVATILFLGSTFGVVDMQSGIRQGCPASGSLFVLLLDPWHRLLMSRLPASLPFGFADDVSIILANFFKHFVVLASVIELLQAAASLGLNMAKCVVVPLRPSEELPKWRRLIRALVPAWRSCAVAWCAKYLGVYLGHGYQEAIWRKPLVEFTSRVHTISTLNGSWCSQVHSYCTYAVSVLTYVMQFAQLPGSMYGDETRHISKVLKAPRNAIPREMAHHMEVLLHKPLPDIQSLARAVMARAWLGFGAASRAEAILSSSLESMDYFVDPVQDWSQHSIVATMATNFVQVNGICGGLATAARPQRVAYKELRGDAELASIHRAIAHRLCVLDKDLEAGMPDKCVSATILVGHVQACKPHVQPSGVQAWVRAAFNAWTTHGRFGNRFPCAFCSAANGDRLDHYASCPVLAFYGRELVPHLWRTGYSMQGIETFLGADAQFPDGASTSVLLAAWIDAVHTTVIAHGRGLGQGTPVTHLAARLKVYAAKFAKGRHSTKWITEGISPSNASMQHWT